MFIKIFKLKVKFDALVRKVPNVSNKKIFEKTEVAVQYEGEFTLKSPIFLNKILFLKFLSTPFSKVRKEYIK